jgi:hypothetical protein
METEQQCFKKVGFANSLMLF